MMIGIICFAAGLMWGLINSYRHYRLNAILFPNSNAVYFDLRYEWAFLPQPARALIFLGPILVLSAAAVVTYKSLRRKK
jgi:hypothetical protein